MLQLTPQVSTVTPQFGAKKRQAPPAADGAPPPAPMRDAQRPGGPQQPKKKKMWPWVAAALGVWFLPSLLGVNGNQQGGTCTPEGADKPAAVAPSNTPEAGSTEKADLPNVTAESYKENQEIASTDEAVTLINSGGVCKAKLVNLEETPTPFFEFTLTNNTPVKFTMPADQADREEVAKALGEKGIFLEHPNPEHPSALSGIIGFMLPIILIFGLIMFMQRRMMGGGKGGGGMFGLGKNFDASERPETRFTDVRGYPEVIEELEEIKNGFDAQRGKDGSTPIPSKPIKGVLLTGPPGTGKTLMARAFAGECGVPFIKISGSDFVEMVVGVGAQRVRKLFENAKKLSAQHGGCVIFIDEIDAVGRQRGAGIGGGNDEREQTLNEILVQMDGFDQNSNVLVMAATNQPGVLDGGLTRSGRFDRKVEVDVPDGPEMRLEILDLYAQPYIANNQLSDDVKLEKIAKITDGFVGADLALLFNEAAIQANRAGRPQITMEDFKEAVLRIVTQNPKKKNSNAKERDRRTVIGHEFGHAVTAMAAQWNLFVVSTVQRGKILGLVMPSRDGSNLTYRDDAMKNLLMTAAGRAAEIAFFGENQRSAGAASDFGQMEGLFRTMMATGLVNNRVVSKYRNPQIPLDQRDDDIKDNVFNAAIDAGVKIMNMIPPARQEEILQRLMAQKDDLLNEDAEDFVRELLGPDFDWDAALGIVQDFVGQEFVDAPPRPAAT